MKTMGKVSTIHTASDRKRRQFYQDCKECAELEAMNAAVNQRLKEQEARAMERERRAEELRLLRRKKVDAWLKAMTASAIFLTVALVLCALACAGVIGWLFMSIITGLTGIVCAFFAGRYWAVFQD